MSLDNWGRIKELFLEALDLPAPARPAFLDERCGEDAVLRAEVEKLLLQHEEAEGFMNRPAVENTGLQLLAESFGGGTDPLLGETVGAYSLTKELGRGGMGAVYLAERADGMFRRQVAVKLVKGGMETAHILRRFRNERRALAALTHPNIAQLYDAGVTRDGLPFFVMEYVEGEPLYQFFDARRLGLRTRLEVFLPICEAVHAAHEKKIVHRDLKPSNILVKADGTPKLLDFGIAKLLDPELLDATSEPTATQMRMMTPEYASPEQIGGGEVTPASDIYSLGVLLYELLSGHRPYRFTSRSPLEIARVVCEQPPENLSRSLDIGETLLGRGEAATLEKVIEARGSNLAELRRALSGDLEVVVMNALDKSPQGRYGTALELAEDIRLYLQGKPVRRGRPSAAAPLAPGASDKPSLAVLPLKIIGAPLSEETGDRYLSVGLADAMITRLSNVPRLVVRPTTSVLRFADTPDATAAGRELGVDFVLSGTVRRAGERIRVSGQLLDVRTNATVWAEMFDENLSGVLELEDAVAKKVGDLLIPRLTGEERRRLARRATDSPAAFEAYLRGRYHLYQLEPSQFVKAKAYFEEAVRLDAGYALAFVGLAEYFFVLGSFAPVPPEGCYEMIREMAGRALALDDSLGEAHAILGYSYLGVFDFENFEKSVRRGIELSPNHPLARVWHSVVLTYFGRYDEAVAEAARAVELNPLGAFEQSHLAWILFQSHRFEEAVAAARKCIAADPGYSHGLGMLGYMLCCLGRLEEAFQFASRAVELSGDNPWLWTTMANCCARVGEKERALEILRGLKERLGENYVLPSRFVAVYVSLGDHERALDELESALAHRDPLLVWIRTDPGVDPLRGYERFVAVAERIKDYAKQS